MIYIVDSQIQLIVMLLYFTTMLCTSIRKYSQHGKLFSFKEWWGNKNNQDETSRMAVREALETLVLTLSPFAPHIAEELGSLMGLSKTLDQTAWPQYIESLTQTDEILIVLQVNGKVRQKISVESGISDDDLKTRSLEDLKIKEWTQGKEVKKVIVIPKKLVNIVVQ